MESWHAGESEKTRGPAQKAEIERAASERRWSGYPHLPTIARRRRCAPEIADLRAREASFRLLFDGNPIPTALCDPDSYAFLAVNDAAAALWGYSREALLGDEPF